MNIFFDLDGTLTNPKLGITRSMFHALERLGLETPDPDDVDRFIGPPLHDSMRKLAPGQVDEAVELYRARYTKEGLYENSVYSGIPEVLAELVENGHILFLATAKVRAIAMKITSHFDLAKYLTAEYGPGFGEKHVDKANLLRDAVAEHAIDSADAVMIGDRQFDFEAAKKVGMASIAVSWGFGTEDELAHADRVCHTPSDLIGAIAEIKALRVP